MSNAPEVPRLPFSVPTGVATYAIALGALVLGLASVTSSVASGLREVLRMVVAFGAPAVVCFALAIRLARSTSGAIGYSVLACAFTGAVGAVINLTLAGDYECWQYAIPGTIFGAFAGILTAPVVAAAARVRYTRAYDAGNTSFAIASLWLFLVSACTTFAHSTISGPRWLHDAGTRPVLLVPLAMLALGVAGAVGSVLLHRRRLAWVARVYDGNEPAWSIEASSEHPGTATLRPLMENAVRSDGVLLVHAHDGNGPFRGSATKTPCARVDMDRARALGGKRQTIYGAITAMVLLVGLPLAGHMIYQLASQRSPGEPQVPRGVAQ